MLIEKINSPKDLKELKIDELNILADEIRDILLTKLSNHGGHIGPNLGMVEATIALHYVFNSPVDKIIFDVSHQTYVHKILTGRKDAFIYKDKYDEVSGFTNPLESEHDLFEVGHTSTSISLVTGVAKARDLKGEKYNVISLIGDGSLSGGEAFEGLNYGATLNSNFIVIVNDNEIAIEENHCGIYENLKELRLSNGASSNNIFKALGYEYYYLNEGNNIDKLIKIFNKVKDANKPVVIHIHTIKGNGYLPAMINKEKYHAGGPFDLKTGEFLNAKDSRSYTNLLNEYLQNRMLEDRKFCVITSGTASGLLFTPEIRNKFKDQFIDVAIAEEDAVAMASGIAKNGGTPVYFVYSSFIQRSFDQLLEDLSINHSPATILVLGASINAMKSKTHVGIYDIPLIAHIPGLEYLAPTNSNELIGMLDYSCSQKDHPVLIRVPVCEYKEYDSKSKFTFNESTSYKVIEEGKDVALIGLGNFFYLARDTFNALKNKGIKATLINPLSINRLDIKTLDSLKKNHKLIVTLEDGILEGGFGQMIASYFGSSELKVLNYGFKKDFYDRYDVEKVMKNNRLDVLDLTSDILGILEK